MDSSAGGGTLHRLQRRLDGPGPLSNGIVVADLHSSKGFDSRPKVSKEEVKAMMASDLRRSFVNHANNHGSHFSQPQRFEPQLLDEWRLERILTLDRQWTQSQVKFRSHGELFPEVKDAHSEKYGKLMARKKPKELTSSLAAIKSMGLVAAGSKASAESAGGPAPAPTRGQMKQLTRMLLGQPHIDMPRMSPKVKSKLKRARSAVQFWQSMGFQGDSDEEAETTGPTTTGGPAASMRANSAPVVPKMDRGPVRHLRAWAGPDRTFGRSTLRESTPWREMDEDRRLLTIEKDLRARQQAELAATMKRMARTT